MLKRGSQRLSNTLKRLLVYNKMRPLFDYSGKFVLYVANILLVTSVYELLESGNHVDYINYWYPCWVYAVLSTSLIAYFGLYSIARTLLGGILRLSIVSIFAFGVALLPFLSITKLDWALQVLIGWVTSAVMPFISTKLFQRFFPDKSSSINCALICAGAVDKKFAMALKERSLDKLSLQLIFNSDGQLVGVPDVLRNDAHLSKESLPSLLLKNQISRVYIYVGYSNYKILEDVFYMLSKLPIDLVWVPKPTEFLVENYRVGTVGGYKCFAVNESPLSSRPITAIIKRALDFYASIALILLLSPVFLIVMLLIKFDSYGPIFYVQKRHGFRGKVIDVYKFRSMYPNSQEVMQAKRVDDRVTPIGKYLRRFSVDELPQLFNVVKGDLSLVGPRPHPLHFDATYSKFIYDYMCRHNIRPGITGLAQVSGARGETETIEKMKRRIDLDLRYINNWSLWLDLRILLKTPFVLWGNEVY